MGVLDNNSINVISEGHGNINRPPSNKKSLDDIYFVENVCYYS